MPRYNRRIVPQRTLNEQIIVPELASEALVVVVMFVLGERNHNRRVPFRNQRGHMTNEQLATVLHACKVFNIETDEETVRGLFAFMSRQHRGLMHEVYKLVGYAEPMQCDMCGITPQYCHIPWQYLEHGGFSNIHEFVPKHRKGEIARDATDEAGLCLFGHYSWFYENGLGIMINPTGWPLFEKLEARHAISRRTDGI